ncbi:GNAT family N-acetyltransferase [Novosphingobium sp. PS1R-30]|uniref:GNAT family N-acetyltransferase n=1 Tax=Novosphingobium anseongense TaxID=3133436 RepID=A0ABU8RS77_9SPHN
MIAIEYHADLKEVQSDAALATLLSSEMQQTPFDRLAWWQGLAEHCGIEPLLAVARDGDSTTVLPLQRANGALSGLANWYSFRLRPVASPGADATGMLTALARDLARKAPRLTLAGLPDEDGSAELVETAFRRAGWIALRETCDTNHVLHLQGRSYDAYLAGRPGPLRTTLKRKTAKVETRIFNQFDAEAWADYEDIYAESWKPSEGSPDFLRGFAQAEGAAGRLRLGVAYAEGRAVAAQMWTIEGGTAFIHKLAHREDAKPLSPGTVLSAALFREVIDTDGVGLIDFGTGNDGYKRDWMEEVRPRYRLEMIRPEAPQNWPFLAKRALKRLAGRGKRG